MLLRWRIRSKAPPPSLTYKRSFYLRMKRRLPLSNRCHSMYKSRRLTSRCVFLRQRFCSMLLQSEVLISDAAEWPNQLGIFFFFFSCDDFFSSFFFFGFLVQNFEIWISLNIFRLVFCTHLPCPGATRIHTNVLTVLY